MASDPIVVGTDGSHTADRAVEKAGELAQSLGATVHVVHSYKPTSSVGEWVSAPGVPLPGLTSTEHERSGGEGDRVRARAEEIVRRARDSLRRQGVDARGHLSTEEPADALIDLADSQRAQMIVVGNCGMTGVRRMLGSVPNKVSHHAHCGVLIVPTSDESVAAG